MTTDPISDMLTRIRNAQAVKKLEVVLPFSKIKFHIAKILEKEGYVQSVEVNEQAKFQVLKIVLKYQNKRPGIQSIDRVSKPGRRVYAKSGNLPYVLAGLGIAIISTPNGLMTNREAHARRLGGEVICEIT